MHHFDHVSFKKINKFHNAKEINHQEISFKNIKF